MQCRDAPVMLPEEGESIASCQVDVADIKHEADSFRIGAADKPLYFGALLMEFVRMIVIRQRQSFLEAILSSTAQRVGFVFQGTGSPSAQN